MTQKEMKEILENVDPEHGWRIDYYDGYAGRAFWFRNFDAATVIAEKEAYWMPGMPALDRPAQTVMSTQHYYFFNEGDGTADKPLSYYRQTKTSVLNLLKEAERKRA